MFIVASHTIKDPDAFWGVVQAKMSEIPSHLKFYSVFPSDNMRRAICLWEAESPEAVYSYLRETFGELSSDEVFEINDKAAVGLPAVASVA